MVVIRSRETLHGEIDLTWTVQNQMLSYLSRRGKGVERLDGDEAADADADCAASGDVCEDDALGVEEGIALPVDDGSFTFGVECAGNCLVVLDVALTTIDNGNIAEP